MKEQSAQQKLVQFIANTGYDIGINMMRHIEIDYQKSFNFLPELTLFFASYVIKKSFTRRMKAPTVIKNCICFFFKNVFEDLPAQTKKKNRVSYEKPVVRVFSGTHFQESHFQKGTQRKMIALFISADYLKSFLKKDAQQFQFLFDDDNTFLIEEIMTDDIQRTVNDIVKKEAPETLKDYHYKLKAMELLYYLFQSLSKRHQSVHQRLSEADIKSIYKVRDEIISSFEKLTPIATLKQMAGMNELKMRKIFTQIFGMGIYDYFQHYRMKEAARLMREEHLSVSEAGYRVGFENLSHFSRVFEKYIGKKPKKYSMESG